MSRYEGLAVFNWWGAFDDQFIENPGYNRDRGPVSVIATLGADEYRVLAAAVDP